MPVDCSGLRLKKETTGMSIKIHVPPAFQSSANNTEIVEINGVTVGECLNKLVKPFPGIERMLFAEDGNLLGYVGIFVNGEDTHPEELAKPVKDGDEIYILHIIGGG
jgi:molybdopterin converting factor small subunit